MEAGYSWIIEAIKDYEGTRAVFIKEVEKVKIEIHMWRNKLDELTKKIRDLDNAAVTFNFIKDVPKDCLGSSNLKESVITILKAAHPNPIYASDIHKIIEDRLQKKFHPKSVGVALRRFSKKGLAHRKGHKWFYVEPRNGTKYSPGAA